MMKKLIYNQIIDDDYLGIITILDYAVNVGNCLSELRIPNINKKQHKVIVDLALNVGMNSYRFVACDVTDDGEILWNNGVHILPTADMVKLANLFIKEEPEILKNSMLPRFQQREILAS